MLSLSPPGPAKGEDGACCCLGGGRGDLGMRFGGLRTESLATEAEGFSITLTAAGDEAKCLVAAVGEKYGFEENPPSSSPREGIKCCCCCRCCCCIIIWCWCCRLIWSRAAEAREAEVEEAGEETTKPPTEEVAPRNLCCWGIEGGAGAGEWLSSIRCCCCCCWLWWRRGCCCCCDDSNTPEVGVSPRSRSTQKDIDSSVKNIFLALK